MIDQTFDFILSSHVIEHQPDLVAHLKQVGRLLRPGGRYFMLVPDKRYCFDRYIPESTIAGVLEAHHMQRKVHTLQSVVEHIALTTHNDAERHWRGDHGSTLVGEAERVRAAIQAYADAKGGYVDVHAWCFTPSTMSRIIRILAETGHIELVEERLYPTRIFGMEFWMILKLCTA